VRVDKNIFIISLILSLFGLIAILTASWRWAELYLGNRYYFIQHQLIYLLLGIAIAFFVYIPSLEFWKRGALLFFILSLISLYAVFIKGIGEEARGVSRWINLGIIQFQPSEFVKIFWVIFLASFLSKAKNNIEFDYIKWIFIFLALIGIALALQPNFSMLFLFILTTFSVLFLANYDAKKLFLIFVLFVSIAFIFAKSKTYVHNRLSNGSGITFPLFSTYQQSYALNLIKDSGLFGKGWGRDQYKIYLPESHNDFIFPVILSEGGWIAGFLIVFSYFYLIYSIFILAKEEKDLFNYLLLCGILSLWSWQILLNISMTLGFLPVMGLPLPFISFGGSSLISNWILVGILLKISSLRRWKE